MNEAKRNQILEDNEEAVCAYCERKYNDGRPLSANEHNLCEGRWCEEANDYFVENYSEEDCDEQPATC